jgi:hypothetical protein
MVVAVVHSLTGSSEARLLQLTLKSDDPVDALEELVASLEPDDQFAIVFRMPGEKRRRCYETRLRSRWRAPNGYTTAP